MAFTVEQLRSKILTSIFGRRLGLDPDGFLVGPHDSRRPIVDATSDTTGTALPNHGYVSVTTTTNDGWTLTSPVPGCQVTLFTGSSSTGTHSVAFSPAVAYSTNGIAGSTATLVGPGGFVTLMGLSTAVWLVVARSSTTNGVVSS